MFYIRWELNNNIILDRNNFNTMARAEEYAEKQLLTDLRRDFEYKILCKD